MGWYGIFHVDEDRRDTRCWRGTPLPGGVRGPCGCEVWARLQRLLWLCPGAGGQHGQLPGERDQREGSDGSVQPLGSLPHVCPDGAGRLSAGSQLHLGDSAAGLPADAVPREPVWPVQPQLVAQDKFSPRSPRSATGCRADPHVAKLVFCIMRRPPSPQPTHPSTNSHQLSGLVSLTET